jgi:hypothetical protein
MLAARVSFGNDAANTTAQTFASKISMSKLQLLQEKQGCQAKYG